MLSSLSAIKRVLLIALISGSISGLVTLFIMCFVASAWFLFIIPAVMGWAIKKYAHITAAEVDADENLESKVGWICGGITLVFVLITTAIVSLLTYIIAGNFGALFLNFLFYIVAGLSVWYGRNRGIQAVVDSYYDSHLTED